MRIYPRARGAMLVLMSTLVSCSARPSGSQGSAPADSAAREQREPVATAVSQAIPSDTRELAEMIAHELIAACPVADPSSTADRDAAAERLSRCQTLLKACGPLVLWGGYNANQGCDPEAYVIDTFDPMLIQYQLTQLNPLVWAKLYLSTFMFPGNYEIRDEGDVTVLDFEARFRADLDPGEYPYPFWHSPNKWTAYVGTQRVYLILRPGHLIGGLRKSPPDASVPLAKRNWDGRWHWQDDRGQPQPRVSLYSYLFSPQNPYVAGLDSSYRELEAQLRQHTCIDCHSPDNGAHMNDLLLLGFPNQALAARASIVDVIDSNRMPPGSRLAGEPAGIGDSDERAKLKRLAKVFADQADAAFRYEASHPKSP